MSPAPSLGPPETVDDLPANRRLETGAPSARSLLLTILGEFVFPRDAAVWTATFVEALAAVGVEEKAARQALARTAAEGIIVPVRVGRRTRWALTDSGRTLLGDGTRRIYGFMREQRRWDGRWLVLAVTVPETRCSCVPPDAVMGGYGIAGTGLWVVPDPTASRGRPDRRRTRIRNHVVARRVVRHREPGTSWRRHGPRWTASSAITTSS